MKMTRSYKYIITFSLFFCYFAYINHLHSAPFWTLPIRCRLRWHSRVQWVKINSYHWFDGDLNGVNFYVVGPTLIELAGLFQTTIEQICLIYTVRSAGYTCGSLSGFLFKYVNRQLTFVFFLIVMGITLALIPHATSLTFLFVLAGINGFSIGSFDTAINVWVLEIWAEDSGPFMQALHFTYGIGSFMAPLICEPFLSTAPIHGSHGAPSAHSTLPTALPLAMLNETTSTTIATTIVDNSSNLNDTKLINILNQMDPVDPVDYLIYIPYSIAGAITVFAAFIVFGLYFYKKYEPPQKIRRATEISQKTAQMLENGLEPQTPYKRTIWDRLPPCLTIWLVSMGSLFLTFFVGMEQMHLQFLPTFAVNTDLDLSPSTAAMMSSAAALAFTVGRCLSIPLAIKLQPHTILYANHLLMLIGTIILAIYANNSETMLWVGNIVLGCGFSSVYASIYAFLEQKIRVTNRIGSLFVFAGGLTAAVSPSLVGQYIEANPLILVWFNLACCLLCLTIFVIIHFTVYLQEKKQIMKTYIDESVDEEMKERQQNLISNQDTVASTSTASTSAPLVQESTSTSTDAKFVAPA